MSDSPISSSPHERRGPYKSWSYTTCIELVRAIAADDVGVDSDGATLLEILQDVYSQGGQDAVNGLAAIHQVIGPDMIAAVLGVDQADEDGRQQPGDAV